MNEREADVDISAAEGPRVLSLFSGAGGLDLGLRMVLPRARTVCYVEGEAFAAANLAAKMEDNQLDPAPIWTDVRTFDGNPWRGVVDCIVGGFPCQDISSAGRLAGIGGAKTGLWSDVVRLAREVGPCFLFLENVATITSRGLDRVLGDLAEIGLDAEWVCVRASGAGAPHSRARWFCLAYAHSFRRESIGLGWVQHRERAARRDNSNGRNGWPQGPASNQAPWEPPRTTQPGVGGMPYGVAHRVDCAAHRVDRLRLCGNGVVPQQAALALEILIDRITNQRTEH